MANRITKKKAETICFRLNETLKLPTDCYVKGEDGRYVAQVGCIHLIDVNHAYNVSQLVNPAGGVRVLAYGLSTREAYDWFTAALEGVHLARIPVAH